MIAEQIKLSVCYCKKKKVQQYSYLRKEGGKKANLKPKQPEFEYYCRVGSSNQPHFLLLPSSAPVCSDASFLVSSWAYESRKIAWVGTSFSTIFFNQNKWTQMPLSTFSRPLRPRWKHRSIFYQMRRKPTDRTADREVALSKLISPTCLSPCPVSDRNLIL